MHGTDYRFRITNRSMRRWKPFATALAVVGRLVYGSVDTILQPADDNGRLYIDEIILVDVHIRDRVSYCSKCHAHGFLADSSRRLMVGHSFVCCG